MNDAKDMLPAFSLPEREDGQEARLANMWIPATVTVLFGGLMGAGLYGQTAGPEAAPQSTAEAAVATDTESAYLGELSTTELGSLRVIIKGIKRSVDTGVYRADFRQRQFDHRTLVPFGFKTLYGLQLLKPELRGLRITIPSHQGKQKPSLGVVPLLKIHGDFQIAASYDLLRVEPPTTGAGAGANLYILAEQTLHAASLRRCVTPQEKDAFFIHVSTRDKKGKRRPKYITIPAASKNGTLCLKRIGSMLQFFVTEGDSEGRRKLHEVDFGVNPLGLLRVETTTDGSPTIAESLWKDLTIRADRLERVNIPLYRNRLGAGSRGGAVMGKAGDETATAEPAQGPGASATEPDEAVLAPGDPRRPLYLVGADGSNLRLLVSMEEYTACGSPDWSSDGAKIAFDAWKSTQGESYRSAHIFVANADGSDPTDLGPGAMPSFSPCGNRIVFSCYSPFGVWTMNADGTERELLDAEGWSARWAPDGRRIAYSVRGDDGKSNICIFDLVERQRRPVLAEKHRHYRSIGINFDWSSNGKRLAFRGDRADGEAELVIVSADGSESGFEIRFEEDVKFDLTWSADDQTLLFPYYCNEVSACQIYKLEVDSEEPATPLKGQPPQRSNGATAWSPDGKTILFSSGPKSK